MSRTEQENLSEPIVIEQSGTRCFSVTRAQEHTYRATPQEPPAVRTPDLGGLGDSREKEHGSA